MGCKRNMKRGIINKEISTIMIIKVIVVITEEVIITTEGQCIRITTGREIIMTTATVTLTDFKTTTLEVLEVVIEAAGEITTTISTTGTNQITGIHLRCQIIAILLTTTLLVLIILLICYQVIGSRTKEAWRRSTRKKGECIMREAG